MKTKTFFICWLPAFIVVFGLNGLFHTLLAANFFDSHLSGLAPAVHKMKDTNPAWVALLDFILTFGMTYFITTRQVGRVALANAAFMGALLNLISAGAWNFANAAMFSWSLAVTSGDLLWHISLGALGGIVIAALFNRSFQKTGKITEKSSLQLS